MHYILQMLLAFIVLFGIVLFLKKLLQVNMGEGLFLAVVLIALFFFLSGMAGTFTYGFYMIIIVSAIGFILWGISCIRMHMVECAKVFSPVMVSLLLLYLFWLFLCIMISYSM